MKQCCELVWCRPHQLLTGLCDALGACLAPQPLPDQAMLCLLLSAVTAGNGAHDVKQSSGDRSQVRRMLELAVKMLWTTHTEIQQGGLSFYSLPLPPQASTHPW